MKIRLDYRKGARENASAFYSLAKECAKKEEGALHAIAQTKKELEGAKADGEKAVLAKKPPVMRRKREWFEKFRWFYSSGGKLVIAGRDAKQNDLLVSKMREGGDFFFHAHTGRTRHYSEGWEECERAGEKGGRAVCRKPFLSLENRRGGC